MDIFAFASQSETQGMVVAEAMAAGNAVVALDGPEIREIVNSRNGILLSGDAVHGDFVVALEELAKSKDALRNLGRSAEDSVRPYGLASCADRLAALYEKLNDEFRSQNPGTFGSWDALQGRLEAEWKLIVEKASALSAAVAETEATRAVLT